jgi:hypothetical protein
MRVHSSEKRAKPVTGVTGFAYLRSSRLFEAVSRFPLTVSVRLFDRPHSDCRGFAADRLRDPIAARYGPRFVIGRSACMVTKPSNACNTIAEQSTTVPQETAFTHSLSTRELRHGFVVDCGAADAIGPIVAVGPVVAIGAIDDIGEADGAGVMGCAVAESAVAPATSVPAQISAANQRFMRSFLPRAPQGLTLGWRQRRRPRPGKPAAGKAGCKRGEAAAKPARSKQI